MSETESISCDKCGNWCHEECEISIPDDFDDSTKFTPEQLKAFQERKFVRINRHKK